MNYKLLTNDLRYFSLKAGHKGGVVVHTVQCTTGIMFQTREYSKILMLAMAAFSKVKSVCSGTGYVNHKDNFGWGDKRDITVFSFSSHLSSS